jgi:hypothetical protein
MSDVKEDSDSSEEDHEAGASVGEERQRNPGQRSNAHHGCDVDRSLAADKHRETRGKAFSERVLAAHRNIEARISEQPVGGDHGRHTHEAELLADVREHHVGVCLGEIEDLLHSLPEADAEDVT